MNSALQQRLAEGLTTLCRAWSIRRKDGTVYGFTDHDRDLEFDGTTFRADTGLSAMALQQTTGLSVDNTEALGALCDASLTEEDILAGRYDGAEVTAWLVNWQAPEERDIVFRGTVGELTRIDGAFSVEIRGLSEALNQPFGRVFQKPCAAVLGDRACGVGLGSPDFTASGIVSDLRGEAGLFVDVGGGFESSWFQYGRLVVETGAAAGLRGVIKRDQSMSGWLRGIDLWEPLRSAVSPGDAVRLVAGCDKRFETCRVKFDNLLNYQGFPDIPEDDWIVVAAPASPRKRGGSRR